MSNRQTVFFLPVDPMDKNHKDPDTIDLNAPRHAQFLHKAWKKHQNTVHWVDINLALKKGLKFCQTRSNAIILYETLPACCIPKVVRMETGVVIHEKVYASPRPPPKISLKHDWMKELGSKVAQRPDGQVVQQSKSSQSNQPNPNPDHDRTGQPLFALKEEHPVLRKSKHDLFMKKLLNMIERGNPLSAVTQITSQERLKHVHLMTARSSTLNIKWHMIERSNPLSAVTQITSQEPLKHVHLMTARSSTLKIKWHMVERGNPLSAVTQVTSQVTSNQC